MKQALPDQADYIDKYGAAGHYHLLELLEFKLMIALREMLDGSSETAAAVQSSVDLMSSIQQVLDEKAAAKIPKSVLAPDVPEPTKREATAPRTDVSPVTAGFAHTAEAGGIQTLHSSLITSSRLTKPTRSLKPPAARSPRSRRYPKMPSQSSLSTAMSCLIQTTIRSWLASG